MYKIYLLLPKPGQNSLRMLLNTVLSSEKAELWCRKPHICGFRKKFKPFGLDPPPTSGHGTTVRFPLAFWPFQELIFTPPTHLLSRKNVLQFICAEVLISPSVLLPLQETWGPKHFCGRFG